MSDPLIKTPWNTEMSPEEFKEYYERKLKRIEEMKGECKREGCSNQAKWITWQYCSNECSNAHLEDVWDDLMED